jgi:PPOX class probable F420-dependent enzyme
MRLSEVQCRQRFATGQVARLASVRPGGAPHLVPIVFALVQDVVFSAVDHKPKGAGRLQRLTNLEAEPRCSLLVDSYDPDWARLWWVRADGRAEVIDDPGHRHPGLLALAERYEAYRGRPPTSTLVAVTVTTWTGWSASP